MGRINLKITNKENFGKENKRPAILDFKTYYEVIAILRTVVIPQEQTYRLVGQSPERDPNMFGK